MRNYPSEQVPEVLSELKVVARPISTNFKSGRRKRVEFPAPGAYRIVFHTTDGYEKGTFSYFNNSKNKVSAHRMFPLNGPVEEYVGEQDTTWHAGQEWWNDISVGWEFGDNKNPADAIRTAHQYRQGALAFADFCYRHELNPFDTSIYARHRDIVGPQRRSCPGGLQIEERIIKPGQLIYKQLITPTMNEELKKALAENTRLKEEALQREKQAKENEQALVDAYVKYKKETEAEILRLQQNLRDTTYVFAGELNAPQLAADILGESGAPTNLLARWKAFVDRAFPWSTILRSLLGYDIFVVAGSEAAFQIVMNYVLKLNLPVGLGAVIGSLATTLKLILTSRYDTNKDGKLDVLDTLIIKNYINGTGTSE